MSWRLNQPHFSAQSSDSCHYLIDAEFNVAQIQTFNLSSYHGWCDVHSFYLKKTFCYQLPCNKTRLWIFDPKCQSFKLVNSLS